MNQVILDSMKARRVPDESALSLLDACINLEGKNESFMSNQWYGNSLFHTSSNFSDKHGVSYCAIACPSLIKQVLILCNNTLILQITAITSFGTFKQLKSF